MNDHLGCALSLQLFGQQLHGGLGVAVDGGVSDDDALVLGTVGGPNVVFIEIVTQILRQYGAVEGADDGNIQGSSFLQQGLYLCAVFAHNADEITAGLAIPGLIHIQCTELAEAVSREKDLIIYIISNDDLGPMDHGSGDKG